MKVSLIRPTVVRDGVRTQTAVWWMVWRDSSTGKQIRQSTKARIRGVAQRIAAEQERKLLLDPWGLNQTTFKPIRWDDLVDEFVAHKTGKTRASTPKVYQRSLQCFGRHIKAGTYVHEITTATLQDFIQQRQKMVVVKLVKTKEIRERVVTVATINKDLRHVRASLNWAASRGYVAKCPSFAGLMLREDRKAPVVVARDSRAKMFAALDDPALVLKVRSAEWWRVFVLLIADMGVRKGEALGLTWGAVDFAGKSLIVHAETSKSRASRALPMTPNLVAQLRNWRKASEATAASDPVLPWPKLDDRAFYDDWRRIVAGANLPKGVKPSPKHFRSTAGSEMIAVGVPTMVVKDFLGHSSVTTTERHYLNTSAATLRAAQRARTNQAG